MPSKTSPEKSIAYYRKAVRALRIISTVSLVLSIMAIAIGLFIILRPAAAVNQTTIHTTTVSNSSFGNRLTNIDQPLNATGLAIINSGPDSYFEKAGEMYLNGSIKNPVAYLVGGFKAYPVNGLVINNKSSVIYLGSITCVFCGENRWAMALALSRFGTFNSLYEGYSALQDSDVPTLYWNADNYTAPGVDLSNHYTSPYVNFITIEDEYPITGGFNLQPLSIIGSEVNSSKNQSDISAFNLINKLNNFSGTPYTIWGNYQIGGADGIVFGNSTTLVSGTYPQITYMTHGQILGLLSNPASQFAWSEYAAADFYIAELCLSLKTPAEVSACNLPAIIGIEGQIAKNSF